MSGNLVVGGRLYVDVLLIDADGRQTELRVADDSVVPNRTRVVRPLVCTDCCAIVTDPQQHNTAHDGPACRVCGCTNDRACELGVQANGNWTELATCHWVERDLCSNPECVAAAGQKEAAVVDLVAALRQSVAAAKARREEQGRG